MFFKYILKQMLFVILLLVSSCSIFNTSLVEVYRVPAQGSNTTLEKQVVGFSSTKQEKRAFYQFLANILKDEKNQEKLIEILKPISGDSDGALYEIEQSIKALEGVIDKEMGYINHLQELRKLSVFGSSNIPLYSLVLQAFIPSTFSKEVNYKPASISSKEYSAIYRLLISKIEEKYNISHINLVNRKTFMGKVTGALDGIPSDLVVYTGSPEKADDMVKKIRNDVTKILSGRDVEESKFKIAFLKFGAGMNPVILHSSASDNQTIAALDSAIEHMGINSGQDCIAPNFTAITSQKAVQAKEYLIREVKKIKESGKITSLAFATDRSIEDLISYRESLHKYLITPNSQIIKSQKYVEPHIFIVPFSKFKELDLREFYAPFTVIVTYSSDEELMEIVRDPRLEKKAMFAQYFGDPDKGTDVIKELKRTKHNVIYNQSVFLEEDGNKPFGGSGPDASSRYVINFDGRQSSVTRVNEPLLISKSVAELYPRGSNNTNFKIPAMSLDSQRYVGKNKKKPISFRLEIEVNVNKNPMIAKYYYPAKLPVKFSQLKPEDLVSIPDESWATVNIKEWEKVPFEKKVQYCEEYEKKLSREYKVTGYYKLESAPGYLSPELVSKKNGYFEFNGKQMIFGSMDDLKEFSQKFSNDIGEANIHPSIVFPRSSLEGFTGFMVFESDTKILESLHLDFQRVFSATKARKTMPQVGGVFVSHSLAPLEGKTIAFYRDQEKRLAAGKKIAVMSEIENAEYKLRYAPIVRSVDDKYPTYQEGLISIEMRTEGTPADEPLKKGSMKKSIKKMEQYVELLEKESGLLIYKQFESPIFVTQQNLRKRLHSILNQTTEGQKVMSNIDFEKWDYFYEKEGKLSNLIRATYPNIDFGESNLSERFLFPLRDWRNYPGIENLDSAEVQKIRNAINEATVNYIKGINEEIESGSIDLNRLRVLITTWGYGSPNSRFSEFLQLFKKVLGASKTSTGNKNCIDLLVKLLSKSN